MPAEEVVLYSIKGAVPVIVDATLAHGNDILAVAHSCYLLKVRVADAKAYDAFYQSLIAEVKIFKVTALLSMEEIKYSTALQIGSVD